MFLSGNLTFLSGRLSKEIRRDTLGREVKVSPIQCSNSAFVEEYMAGLEAAKSTVNNRMQSEDRDDKMGLLKIRDNPTRARRLSSRTPKFQPIKEIKRETPPALLKKT